MSELIKITGLWENKDKDGNTYLSGNLSQTSRILIFWNKKKEGKSPDASLYICQPKEKSTQKNIEHKRPSQNDEYIPF